MASGGSGNSGASAAGGSSGNPAPSAGEAGESGGDGGAAAVGASAGGGAAGSDVVPPVSCEEPCVPHAPSGWQGPMALWEGQASGTNMPPSCPAGYAEPVDLHRELIAPPGPCTCSCSAQGQVCEATLRIYEDMACSTNNVCATVSTSTGSCTGVSGCTGSQGSARLDAPTISGGTCSWKVAQTPPPSWKFNDRLCKPTSVGSCDDDRDVCAPSPPIPYASQLCVVKAVLEGQPIPQCPSAYPSFYQTLHEAYTDARGCSDCTCGNVSGGSCTGTALISSGIDCSAGPEFAPSTVCKVFDLGSGGGVHPTHVGGKYVATAGTCNVAVPSTPFGMAVPSGYAHVVCCQATN